jgi:hypothetical protein
MIRHKARSLSYAERPFLCPNALEEPLERGLKHYYSMN